MPLPGWNVSEPIDLAHKLYKVVESLRSAPDGAKAFISKIKSFKSNLDQLQEILESRAASHAAQDFKRLRATILECEACVKRCEEYGERFHKLTKDGGRKMDGMGQAARWALQKEKVARLREEIDGHMNSIGLTLTIQTFADARTRQDSYSATESLNPPTRSGTLNSLPAYSSPRPNWCQGDGLQQPRAPADLLEHVTKDTRETSDEGIPNFQLEPQAGDVKDAVSSRRNSPVPLRPLTEHDESYGLDSKGAMRPLERRRNTTSEVAVSPTGLGISGGMSDGSSAASLVFTSPTISSRHSSITEVTTSTSRRDSILDLDSADLEMKMENLDGVQASYYRKKNSRLSYPVSTIESFRNKQTGRRFIVISPPTTSNIKLYFVLPTERIIAHSEHPQAYGSTLTHKVKFIEPYLLRSQKPSERRSSDVSSTFSPPYAPESSAASVVSSRSLGSPTLTANNGILKEESRHQEYDFEDRDHYRRFQELLMGPGTELQLQIPIQSITAKRYGERKPSEESRLQYLRLWQSGGFQTLMFFANKSSNRYREYRVENFRPVESRSKTTIRLDVHLPGMVRRRSSAKSPLILAQSSAQEQTKVGGDTDENDMSDLDNLSIEFGSAQDKDAFLRKANFHH